MFLHEFDRTAIMEAVGEFDQHHSDIVIESQKDTLEILSLDAFLFCLVLIVEHGLDLCQTIHEGSYLLSE
jgi:hypothetical protein